MSIDVIFINGPSSSGKSAIAQELQKSLDSCYLHVGLDAFISMMPSKANKLSKEAGRSEGFYFEECLVDGKPASRVRSGELGVRVNQAYRETVALIACSGIGVLVDDVVDGGNEWQQWRSVLSDFTVLKVGLYCDEDVLARREITRGDRRIGSAVEQARRVHVDMEYDLTVDTTAMSSIVCAENILDHIKNI
jgi:chloramphenicol 3-O phosphotransferase